MLKHIYKGIFGVLLIGFAACSTEQFEEDALAPGTTPIQLMGAVTRADDTNGNLGGYTGLFLTAKTDATTYYFTNNAITVGSGNETKSVLNVDMYYPLDKNKEISLYGHSGEVTDGKISLTSGTAATNDALISNGTDGVGTEGSANDPVKLLTFRHVMTKVTVKVEVDKSVQDTKPTSIQIGFDDSKVAGSGKYALGSKADKNEKATDISGSYTLEGSADGTDNYLVPTGATLSGTAGFIKSLIIDDYTATEADRNALTIPQADLNNDLILKPGLAYTLTFKIKRLKVVDIALEMKEWDIKTGNGEWGYDPYKVKMNVTDGYSNSGDNLISKIVLHYTPNSNQGETYQYIGTGVADGNDVYAHFVTLPKAENMTDGTLKADLYTRNGLLIVGHEVKYERTSTFPQFDISLGSNGMVRDADNYYQVTTPLQFYNMMSNPEAVKYRLTENIDINSLPLEIRPKDFPAGAELDGNGKSILHLKLKGTGLFTTNNGTLKNIHSSFCSIDATGINDTYVGGLCSINNGTIEGCINEADLKTEDNQIAGGICGKNNGEILACLNTGNIPAGAKIGGICGENEYPEADAIKACINAGMLHGSSNHQRDSDIGGICGYQSVTKTSDAVINSCFWLTGTSRPAQGSSDEKAIGSFAENIPASGDYCTNTTNMTETLLRTEAVTRLNVALNGTSWKFEWEKDGNGTYKTVWPMPVKTPTTTP